jgi:hypothetical protein
VFVGWDVDMDGYIDGSKDGFAGRLEVIEGRTGRRRWSDAEKARIASESFRPGARVAELPAATELRAGRSTIGASA